MLLHYSVQLRSDLQKILIQIKRLQADLVTAYLVAVVRLNGLVRCNIKEHTRNRMRLITKLYILILDASENLIQIAGVQRVNIVLRLHRMRIVFDINDENCITLGQHDVTLHDRQHCSNTIFQYPRYL